MVLKMISEEIITKIKLVQNSRPLSKCNRSFHLKQYYLDAYRQTKALYFHLYFFVKLFSLVNFFEVLGVIYVVNYQFVNLLGWDD